MTMAVSNFVKVFFVLCLCFAHAISESTDCKCPGPLSFYEDLGCTPVFNKSGDCCAERYNCDVLKSLPTDKCIINGKEYNIGESLKEEDANPCDVGCYCSQGARGPQFTCAIVDCFFGPKTPGCYSQRSAMQCCSGPEICPEKEEDRPTCVVDGKTYKDGEYFQLANEPDKTCYCGPGYTGENVEPFCASPKHSYCGTLFHHIDDVREGCVPTYYSTQSPKTSCSVAYRCQNDKDIVIKQNRTSSEEAANPDMQCKFGNLVMELGDELNQATDYSSVCMKCVCDVPPVPTCQRLPDEECDVTIHPAF